LTDTLVYLPLDYLTFLPPAIGGTYVDQIFGTPVKRLSNALSTRDNSTNRTLTFIRHEYATMSPFNNDNTRLLLQHQSYWGLYTGAGNYTGDLPFEIGDLSEPRWSRNNSNILYYHPENSNQLKQYNVATNTMSIVHTFSEYATIGGLHESDISFDGDKFVLIGDAHDIFVYTLSTDTKGPVFNIAGLGGIDQLQITPDNHVLVGWLAGGLNRFNGIELYDQNMNFLRQVAPVLGHYDVTRDINGDEIMLWSNAADPNPICLNGVVKVRLSDAHQTCLVSFDFGQAVHVSAPDGGWVFVTTYDPSDPLPLLGIWKTYTNEILQIKLDGSEVRRLAHHRSRPFDSYNWQPQAAVSRDGTKLVYNSNYGLQSILGNPNNYSDAYQMDGLDAAVLDESLSVTKTGSGRVTSNPAGIDCGTDCTAPYPIGTIVTLTASPDPGAAFLGWSGACAGQGNPCQVTMDSPKVATASFSRVLSVTKTGNGRVTSSPAGIDCGTDCTESYPDGTVVTLTAIPDSGWTVLGWSGACAGQGNPCQVTMNDSKNAAVTFAAGGGGGSTGGGSAPFTDTDGGCFIATAAFGSPLAAEVQVLRAVRDRFLLTSAPGQLFVQAYYRLSPPLARVIASREWLKHATRGALRPVIWWARLSLDSPATAMGIGIVCFSAGSIILLTLFRSRRRDS
jgi:hypothetical protein